MRLGQLPEHDGVTGERPGEQVGRHDPHPRVTSSCVSLQLHSLMDTGRGANWAVRERPVFPCRGVRIITEREPKMMLKDKVAVIYGAGGAIGGAVARAFAREGATVFLTG